MTAYLEEVVDMLVEGVLVDDRLLAEGYSKLDLAGERTGCVVVEGQGTMVDRQ